jgi:lipoate-protein ligase B
MSKLLFKDLGRMDYLTALALQEALVERKQREGLPDMLLLVEHPHVFTIGRGGKQEHLLHRGNIPFHRTSRGGDITYHGPGQIVVYPLIDLRSRLRRDVHVYLRRLERTAILALKGFGISAKRKPPWTGVWIGHKKIASIGVAVRRGITYHGLALNVSTDLAYFNRIIPCGLPWAEVTSMERELGREIPLAQAKEELTRNFVARFGYRELQELCLEDIPTGSKLEPRAVPTTSV